VKAYTKGTPKKFGTQTEKGRVIYVFRNADKHHKGVKLVIHPTKFKTLPQVKDSLSKLVGLPTGSVRQIFTPEGQSIKSIDDFEDEGKYIACGAEKLSRDLIPPDALIKSVHQEEPEEEEQPEEEVQQADF